jgi:phospholipid/cholesterol/gamma-HCH transport system substrate-binding protein
MRPRTDLRQTLAHRALGVAFLGLLVLAVLLTYAVYNKTFADVVTVEVRASRVGMQLPRNADVKIRGVIVGEVRSVSTSGSGATVEVALDADKAAQVPSDVSARIVPKTLFGEKYVELVPSDDPSATPIAAGDVIERAVVPVEVEEVLADTYPLITAVQPVDLASTLNAVATGLEGRGSALGDNLVRLDALLRDVNPVVPEAIDDLRRLRRVADVYRQVLPDLALALDNTVLTGNTVVEKREQLAALLDDVTGLSDTTRGFLRANADGIVAMSEVSRPTLELLARYSPEIPCLTRGLVRWIPRMESVYRDHVFHINLEVIPHQPTGYGAADAPVYGADNGPTCLRLPDPPYSQDDPGPQPDAGEIEDGVESEHGKNQPSRPVGEAAP